MWLLFIILQFSPAITLASGAGGGEAVSAAVSGAVGHQEISGSRSPVRSHRAAKLASEGAYLSNQGHFKKALAKFKRALKMDPENASLCLNLGLVYQELRNYKKALLFLEKAAVLDPESARAQYSLALLYEAVAVSPGIIGFKHDAAPSDFWEKARAAWMEVIKLEKDASKKETARKHIKRIMIEVAKQSRIRELTGNGQSFAEGGGQSPPHPAPKGGGGGPPETGEQ